MPKKNGKREEVLRKRGKSNMQRWLMYLIIITFLVINMYLNLGNRDGLIELIKLESIAHKQVMTKLTQSTEERKE